MLRTSGKEVNFSNLRQWQGRYPSGPYGESVFCSITSENQYLDFCTGTQARSIETKTTETLIKKDNDLIVITKQLSTTKRRECKKKFFLIFLLIACGWRWIWEKGAVFEIAFLHCLCFTPILGSSLESQAP